MAENLTPSDVLAKLAVNQTDKTNDEFRISGIVPDSLTSVTILNSFTVLGVTPEDFAKDYAAVEFNFEDLCKKFSEYVKDFNDTLTEGKASKALEFSANILFQSAPNIRNEKKSKGDKAIRYKFPYKRDDGTLSIRVVIVSTFKDIMYSAMEDKKKLILTFKQASMLSMVTFMKAAGYLYAKDGTVLMSPLCGAVFSRENVKDIAKGINMEETQVVKMINASCSSGGQYLPESNIACAIVASISATKRISNKEVRNQIISKCVKQYSSKNKPFLSSDFTTLSKYALGGVPPGLDPETLIEQYTNVQRIEISSRVQAKMMKESAVQQTEKKPSISRPPATKPDIYVPPPDPKK